jgi:hypothetical protein
MINPQLNTLGEQMFLLLSPYMEKEEAEKLSSQILLLLLEDRKPIYDSFIHHCDNTIDKQVDERFKRQTDVISESYVRGTKFPTNFFRQVFNNRINLDKDQMIEILKIMK